MQTKDRYFENEYQARRLNSMNAHSKEKTLFMTGVNHFLTKEEDFYSEYDPALLDEPSFETPLKSSKGHREGYRKEGPSKQKKQNHFFYHFYKENFDNRFKCKR